MSETGRNAFDSTIHTTNSWLNEIAERLGWQNRTLSYPALRAANLSPMECLRTE